MESKRLSFFSGDSDPVKKILQLKAKIPVPDLRLQVGEGQIRDAFMKILPLHSRREENEIVKTTMWKEPPKTAAIDHEISEDEAKRLDMEREREEEELRDVWETCPIVTVDQPNPKRDLETYKHAVCCLGIKLAADAEPKEKEIEKPKKNDLFDWLRGTPTRDAMQLDARLINTLLDSITKEISKGQDDPDKLYIGALITFERDLRRRTEEILAAKVRIPDLVAIFSDTLGKELRLSQSKPGAKSLDAAQRDFESLLSSVLKVKLSKKHPVEQDLGDRDALGHLSAVFQISKEVEAETSHQCSFNQTQKGLFLEMSTNLPLIDSNPFYNSSTFPTREMLDIWKARETKAVHSLLKKIDESAYQVFEMSEKSKTLLTGKTKIRIKVAQARNLTGKDKTGKSDPYVTIEYDKEIFSTNVVEQNLDPVWDEQITLSVRDPKGKIILQVWDKDPEDEVKAFSAKFWKEETDDFLGMCTFTAEEIIAKGYEPWHGWFPLQKRSKRSHISGDIYLSFQNVAPEATIQDRLAVDRMTVSVPHHQLYKYLMKALLKYEFTTLGNRTGELCHFSNTLLVEYSLRYRIGTFFHRICYFGFLVELQTSIGVDINVLFRAFAEVQECFQDKMPLTREERDMYEKAVVELEKFLYGHLLRYRDCYPFAKPSGSIENSIAMLTAMYKDPIFIKKVQALAFEDSGKESEPEKLEEKLFTGLKESAVRYYNRMSEEAMPMTEQSVEKLIRLVTIIMDSLDDDSDHFERPLSKFQDLSITLLNTIEYMKFLHLEVENLVIEVTTTDDIVQLVNMFELFHRLWEFYEDYIEPMKPKGSITASAWETSRSLFDVNHLFRPVFKRWFIVTESQLLRWIDKALELDKFEATTETVLHSTSVIDMISAIDQSGKFLNSLKIQPQLEHARLINHLSRIYSSAVQHYGNKIFGQVVAQAQASQKEDKNFFSFLKSKASPGALPFEITQQNLVKLNNIEAIRTNLHQLYDTMDVDSTVAVLKQAPQRSEEDLVIGEKKVSGNLTIWVVRAEGLRACDANGRSDPYTVIKKNKKVMARTRTIEKTLNPKWEDKFEIYLDDSKDLEIQVYDQDLLSSDDLCGEAVLHLGQEKSKLLDSDTHSVWLNLLPQGRILLRVKFEARETQNIDFQFTFMFRFLKRQIGDVSRIFVEQMTPYFAECVSKIVTESKSKGFLKTTDTSDCTPHEAQQALQPLIKYLETNLTLLSEKLYIELCQLMVKKIWKAIIRSFKLAMLPNVEEDILVSGHRFHKKLQLSSRQVSMVEHSLQVLFEFFEADGKGLEKKALENRRHKELTKALQLYQQPPPVLIKAYMDCLAKRIDILKDIKDSETRIKAIKELDQTVSNEKDKLTKEQKMNEKKIIDLEKNHKDVEREKEMILLILDLKDDKDAKKFVEEMLKELELERKWAGNQQTEKD